MADEKEMTSENTEEAVKCEKPKSDKKKSKEKELEVQLLQLKEEKEKAEKALAETEDKYKRVLAEYDNFRKRTVKEKEGIYSDAYGDAIKEILPVIDNLERAAACAEGDQVMQGVKMTLTQFVSILERLGIEVIDAKIGDPFDPEYQNAVLHVDNPELGESVIANVLQKGYKKGDKVYRYAMVAVAN